MDSQSDLEVILEFLEEYYRQSSVDNEGRLYSGVPVGEEVAYEQRWICCDPPIIKVEHEAFLAHDITPPPTLLQNTPTEAAAPEHGSLPNSASTRQTTKHRAAAAGRGRKLRLFQFLFEMLEDPTMAHCVSWVPAAAGVFRFSSRNKDQVARLWGQRKGNKRPMTYQKMSRALRNYGRSGEIFKVKKKLTYQFSPETLTSLRMMWGRHGDL